ncbi:hypothetical protein CR513_52080, partial [Mucuna pruriens]
MKATKQREDELRQQIAMMKVVAKKPGGTMREAINVQAFWGQPFSKEIDETPIPPNFREVVVEPFDGTQDPHAHLQAFQTQMYISGGNDSLSCKLFPNTLHGIAMHWMATLPTRSIRSFNDLVGSFILQFAANKVKQVEVADLFNIKQAKGESLKSYLARFNNATKGLRADQFSDALALRRPSSMEEIRACTKKHIEVEEDQADWLEVERQPLRQRQSRLGTQGGQQKGEAKHPVQARPRDNP